MTEKFYMPTGYTADINKGISFETFALNCARAFGACITLRDEDGGGEKIPEVFEPSDYHAKKLDEARAELAKLCAMSAEECDAAADADFVAKEASRLESLRDNEATIKAYYSMLDQARLWLAPTPEHDGLKNFMIEQIESSIKFDDTREFYKEQTQLLTGQQWLEERLAKVIKDISYHTKEHNEEVERAENRTNWIKALRSSLK